MQGTPVTRPDEAVLSTPLLPGLRAQQAEAFEVLIARFEGPLYRFFYYSHGDTDLARDQSADTFAELVTALPKMRGGEEQLRAFVFGVARNVLRRGWRVRTIPAATDEELESVQDMRPGTFEQVAQRESFRRAIQLIGQFDEPARQVMLLRFVEDLKLVEVSGSMGMPLNTVKSIIRRSCAKLREHLEAPAKPSAQTMR
jgi:RNA polymerase sigma-70 factor, ECF subfamily